MSKEIPFLQCIVEIRSDKTLEEVAELVSARLLGGIRFVGRDRFVYDEVPAIFAEHEVLGLKIVLQGFGGAEPYFLEIHPGVIAGDTLKAKAAREIDLTDYIVGLLQDVEGISTTKK